MTQSAYPKTTAAFEAMGALDHLERIRRLDEDWQAIRAGAARPASQLSYTCVAHLPEPDPAAHYDLIYAGGGLGLIHAAVMAKRYGLRVLVFDQGQVGCAHREWNISREELHEIVACGLCSWDELQHVIMAEYESGVVRFHDSSGQAAGGGHQAELWLPNVLNLALDADALLRLARHVLESQGGHVRDNCRLHSVEVNAQGTVQVSVVLEHRGQGPGHYQERLSAHLLIDGMGSSSPLTALRFAGQPFAGVCPTVGTVVRGLEPGNQPWQHNPKIGDILLTIADAQRGQQYMWEGFPGRGDELTVYLFYYETLHPHPQLLSRRRERGDLLHHDAISPSPVYGRGGRGVRANNASQRHLPKTPHQRGEGLGGGKLWTKLNSLDEMRKGAEGLLDLFEDYFTLLPTYKRPGPEFQHLKPVYGYIPARHSMRRQEANLLPGVLPIGDAAAQQSPLTFCGFGSHIRNLGRTTSLLHAALRDNLTQPQHLSHISAYQANVSMNWIMSRFMQPWSSANSVNELQNVFLDVLNKLGLELATRFFRDQMRWGDYHPMILGMFRAHPGIVLDAWQVLGTHGIQRWIADYLRYSREAVLAWGGRRLGERGRIALLAAATKQSPVLGLALRARIEEWRVMGWL